jgi:hypothetical protein
MSQRSRTIDDDKKRDVLLLEISTDIELVAARKEVPVYGTRIVSDLVFSILSELYSVAATRRTVGTLAHSKEGATGPESECVENA